MELKGKNLLVPESSDGVMVYNHAAMDNLIKAIINDDAVRIRFKLYFFTIMK